MLEERDEIITSKTQHILDSTIKEKKEIYPIVGTTYSKNVKRLN
jgi:hypothetical protein